MTPEQKAKIARDNGAKSKGPTTETGKDRARAHALKHGHRATTLAHLAQPHSAVFCNEDTQAFFRLFADLVAAYQPAGAVALDIVREIAAARWEITRAQLTIASNHNRAIHLEQSKPHNLPDELKPVEIAINVNNALFKLTEQYSRAIDRSLNRIARLERRLQFVHKNFPIPGPAPERTNDEIPQPMENEVDDPNPLITDDPSETTRKAYELFFPGRKLFVVKPETNEVDEPEDNLT